MFALTVERAHRAYDTLVLYAGADPDDREQFVLSVTEPRFIHEYRFQGSLGFGGKFYAECDAAGIHCRVGCYPEDRTVERDAVVDKVNYLFALPDCDEEIYRDGSTVCVLSGEPENIEAWVKLVAQKTSARMDWYYNDHNIGVIMYLGDTETRDRIIKAIRNLGGQFRGLIIQADVRMRKDSRL